MKAVLWAVTAGVLAMATFPSWSALLVSRSSGVVSADAETVVLAVSGMTCSACAIGIEKSLTTVSGVQAASVDFAAGQATVYVDPGEVSGEDLLKAVQSAGEYTAQIKKSG